MTLFEQCSLEVVKRAETAMAGSCRFRIRLLVRVAKGFSTEKARLSFSLSDKEVFVASKSKGEPLRNAQWLVFSARGFTTEEEAKQFGERLRLLVQLASLSTRLGIDTGEDRPTSWISDSFARSIGLIRNDERVAPNVHGLAILPDDDKTRFPVIDIKATVTADPGRFLCVLHEWGKNDEISLGAAKNGVRLLNLALMTSQPLAQMVLAFSAIEELSQTEKWSEMQRALIAKLADIAQSSTEGTAEERAEIAHAIRTGLFRLSIRQSVMRLLSRLDLDHLRKEWDRLYSIRSRLFHGTDRLTDSEVNRAAQDTITLCGQIILSILHAEGVRVPPTALSLFDAVRQ